MLGLTSFCSSESVFDEVRKSNSVLHMSMTDRPIAVDSLLPPKCVSTSRLSQPASMPLEVCCDSADVSRPPSVYFISICTETLPSSSQSESVFKNDSSTSRISLELFWTNLIFLPKGSVLFAVDVLVRLSSFLRDSMTESGNELHIRLTTPHAFVAAVAGNGPNSLRILLVCSWVTLSQSTKTWKRKTAHPSMTAVEASLPTGMRRLN